MNKILIASRNSGKIDEYRELLQGLPVVIVSLLDFSDLPEIKETGTTFRENALIKARVALVARTPILLFLVFLRAACTPGSIIPKTGTGDFSCKQEIDTDELVLQAAITALTV
jgi:hypothetical protein